VKAPELLNHAPFDLCSLVQRLYWIWHSQRNILSSLVVGYSLKKCELLWKVSITCNYKCGGNERVNLVWNLCWCVHSIFTCLLLITCWQLAGHLASTLVLRATQPWHQWIFWRMIFPRALAKGVQHFHHTQCCVLGPITQML
jgi:hypothetical protein